MTNGNQQINKIMKDLFAYMRLESEGMYLLLRRSGWTNNKIAKGLGVSHSGLRRKYGHLKV